MKSAVLRVGSRGVDGRRAGSGPANISTYVLLITFLVVIAAAGQVGLGLARILFVAGCVGVAYQAYRAGGLALHLEVLIVLFASAPLLRRMVDLHAGYDASGTMLIGPLAAITVALGELKLLLAIERSLKPLVPYAIMLVCVVYGWALSAFQNDLVESTVLAIKYAMPMLYCLCLLLNPQESDKVLNGAARAFLAVSPVIGLYGVAQHLAPQSWDQAWMIASKIPSIGQPLPGQVRVFSTMNSPVSFAAYATCGLLLLSFAPRTAIPPILIPLVAILPLSLAILLTSVRTAWISASVSLLFCILFNATRRRAVFLMICLAFGVAFALLFTSFGDVISDRFATLDSSNMSEDGSAHERMNDYIHVFSEDNRYILGIGLFRSAADPKMTAQDGQILTSAVQMGTVVGMIHVMCVAWAGLQGVFTLRRNEAALRLVAAALVVGDLVIMPLTAIATGEIGFLYFTLAGILTGRAARRRD